MRLKLCFKQDEAAFQHLENHKCWHFTQAQTVTDLCNELIRDFHLDAVTLVLKVDDFALLPNQSVKNMLREDVLVEIGIKKTRKRTHEELLSGPTQETQQLVQEEEEKPKKKKRRKQQEVVVQEEQQTQPEEEKKKTKTKEKKQAGKQQQEEQVIAPQQKDDQIIQQQATTPTTTMTTGGLQIKSASNSTLAQKMVSANTERTAPRPQFAPQPKPIKVVATPKQQQQEEKEVAPVQQQQQSKPVEEKQKRRLIPPQVKRRAATEEQVSQQQPATSTLQQQQQVPVPPPAVQQQQEETSPAKKHLLLSTDSSNDREIEDILLNKDQPLRFHPLQENPEAQEIVQIPERTYTNATHLNGKDPKPGDIIAYKKLELSFDYTPSISKYKEGKVTAYDNKTKMITMEHLYPPIELQHALDQVAEGNMEEDEEEHQGVERLGPMIREEKLSTLMEVLLLSTTPTTPSTSVPQQQQQQSIQPTTTSVVPFLPGSHVSVSEKFTLAKPIEAIVVHAENNNLTYKVQPVVEKKQRGGRNKKPSLLQVDSDFLTAVPASFGTSDLVIVHAHARRGTIGNITGMESADLYNVQTSLGETITVPKNALIKYSVL